MADNDAELNSESAVTASHAAGQVIETKMLPKQRFGPWLEIGVFLAISLSTLQLSIAIPALIALAITSAVSRDLAWSDMGLQWPSHRWLVGVFGVALGAALQFSDRYWVAPLQELLFNEPTNLESFSGLTLPTLAVWIAISWTVAAFCEEWLFRGYLMGRLRDLLGDSTHGRMASLAISSLAFGGVHYYQGLSGAFAAMLFGMFFGIAYLVGGRSLLAASLAHGTADTIGFLELYRQSV